MDVHKIKLEGKTLKERIQHDECWGFAIGIVKTSLTISYFNQLGQECGREAVQFIQVTKHRDLNNAVLFESKYVLRKWEIIIFLLKSNCCGLLFPHLGACWWILAYRCVYFQRNVYFVSIALSTLLWFLESFTLTRWISCSVAVIKF